VASRDCTMTVLNRLYDYYMRRRSTRLYAVERIFAIPCAGERLTMESENRRHPRGSSALRRPMRTWRREEDEPPRSVAGRCRPTDRQPGKSSFVPRRARAIDIACRFTSIFH
jgi:hypothetical protein